MAHIAFRGVDDDRALGSDEIGGQEDFLFREVEGEVARGVTGGVEGFQGARTVDGKKIEVADFAGGQARKGEALQGFTMGEDRELKAPGERSKAADVVAVVVGGEEALGLISFLDPGLDSIDQGLESLGRRGAGIDDQEALISCENRIGMRCRRKSGRGKGHHLQEADEFDDSLREGAVPGGAKGSGKGTRGVMTLEVEKKLGDRRGEKGQALLPVVEGFVDGDP